MCQRVAPVERNYTYGDKPVVFVSWFDAARFANWVNNGATAGASTETGAYTMANGVGVSRNVRSKLGFCQPKTNGTRLLTTTVLPGVYYDYPTKSSVTPRPTISRSMIPATRQNYFGGKFHAR